MGDGSPLFHSALELLAHACEHYAGNQERDRRLVILHLANAIELLLKDRLLDSKISIYENPKQTKTITKVFNDLEKQGIAIPLKPILELLIDERNNIQHRFGSPNSLTVKYYFDSALKFFNEFMNQSFGLELRDYLSNLLDANTLRIVYPASESSKDVLQQARSVARVHPSSSVVTAWMEIEKKIDLLRNVLRKEAKRTDSWIDWPVSSFMRSLTVEVMKQNADAGKLRRDIVHLSVIRNRVVHADTELSDTDAQNYIEQVETILPEIDRLKAELLKGIQSKSSSSKKLPLKSKSKHK